MPSLVEFFDELRSFALVLNYKTAETIGASNKTTPVKSSKITTKFVSVKIYRAMYTLFTFWQLQSSRWVHWWFRSFVREAVGYWYFCNLMQSPFPMQIDQFYDLPLKCKITYILISSKVIILSLLWIAPANSSEYEKVHCKFLRYLLAYAISIKREMSEEICCIHNFAIEYDRMIRSI